MNDDDEVITIPELQTVTLDDAKLEQLLFDVAHAATSVEVRLKSGPTALTWGASPSIAEARATLQRGEASAMQLRYAFQGKTWVDTLMQTPEGIRLVRMADQV